ncbi:MAG TPA: DUF4476 domain-containing protein, partial [Chitinophagaceae bacterium]
AKQAYSKVTDPLNFGTLATVFSIAENREDLSAYVRAQGRDVVYSYSESFRIPMADQKFNQVMDGIEQQWQEGARLSTIIDLFENNRNYFTSSQAVELISSVADESSRLHLAKAVYSRLTDPENFATIYSLFSDTAMVSSLRSYIAASADNMIGVHNYGKTALSDDQFADLYQASRSHFRSKSILRAVHEAFTDSARFYTSYQARQLIMLVKNENDRLQLAKDAYRQIVDAENFLAQMNDLFAWEANRQQLADYVAEFKP